MTEATLAGVDLYARHTDTNGKTMYMAHRVWDKELFIAEKTAEATRENSKVKAGESRLAKFEQITEQQYNAARGRT